MKIRLLFALVVGLCGSWLHASDWPAFGRDAQRSGISDETVALPLTKAWMHQPAHAPTPAWPEAAKVNWAVNHELRNAMLFDSAFHVVADAESVYFGSSADDTVYALNAANGEMRWTFTTEGPVRLPPVLAKDKLYAGSDDGCVYCLNARTGSLIWKYRVGEDKRLPGNGRMISLWPVRGGLVLDGGTLCFTAGIFPDRGVYLCAVDAERGKKIYRKELTFSVQGTMLTGADRLFVPTGRTSYRACAKEDGKLIGAYGASDPWKKNLVGGCFGQVVGDALGTGPSEAGQYYWFRLSDRKMLVQDVSSSMLVHGELVYALSKGQLKAYDRAAYLADKSPTKVEKPAEKTGDKPVDKTAAKPQPAKLPGPTAPNWSASAGSCKTMIWACGTILAGGKDEISAFDAKDGHSLWSEKVDGTVESLVFCNGRLLASLDSGEIVCFQKGAASPATVAAKASEPYPADAALSAAAEAAVKTVSTTRGYCLVLEAGTGQLAYEIAKRSEFHVICREKDAAKARAARVALMKAGLYGTRVIVQEGESDELPYPKFFANLIVCERTLTEGSGLPSAEKVLRVLRPFGGVVDISAKPGSEAGKKLKSWGSDLPGWKVTDSPVIRGTAVRGKVAGSGEWTHFYADPSNTACSNDEIRPGKMDLLWFGRPGPTEMVDRHKKGPAPLFKNGRLFVSGFNYVAAADAYNGTILWERQVLEFARIAAFKDCSNMAVMDDRLFVASAASCLVLNAQTGKTEKEIPVPGATPESAWGYVAVVDGTIVGSAAKVGGSLRAMGKAEDTIIWRNIQPVVCSTQLFGIDQTAGTTKWTYPAQTGLIVNPTITIAKGCVYFVISKNAKTLESKNGRATLPELVGEGAQLVALDLATGKEAWSVPIGISSIQHVIYMSYANDTLVITGTKHAVVDPSETQGRTKPTQLKRVRYDLFAFDAASGAPRWKTTQIPNFDDVLDGGHGEQVQHPAIDGDVLYGPDFALHVKTGEPYTGWKWKKSAKCATLSLSRYCAFSRFTDAKVPMVFDLATGKSTTLSIVTRPGCWINTLPVGGLILIPEASAGCTCPYPFQASMAFVPAD